MVSTAAIGNALSALKANQAALTVASNNIANASSEGYVRRGVLLGPQVVGTVGAGVKIETIERKVDDFLVRSIQQQVSNVGRTDIMFKYFDRTSLLYGQPDAENSLSSTIDRLFSSLGDLTNNPEQAFFKTIAVSRARDLTQRVAGIANDLQELRFTVDQEIDRTVDELNSKLASIKLLNVSIADAHANRQDKSSLFDQRDRLLQDISRIVDVRVLTQDSGEVSLVNDAGELLTPANTFLVEYTRLQSVQSIINNSPFGAITVTRLDDLGNVTGDAYNLATSGTSDAVTVNFDSGTLKGLLEMRDVELPKLIAQLDEFSSTFTAEFNALHNEGSSFPPINSLTGTQLISSTDSRIFDGKVRIALLNADGTPVSSPFANEDTWRPLTLDLSTLDSGAGAGEPTIQDIMDEINEYYGTQESRVNLGSVEDIKLAAISDDDGPPFLFDFQVENTDNGEANFRVTSVTVVGDAGVTVGAVPAALGVAGVDVAGGDRVRTGSGNPISINFSGGTTGPIYTIRVGVTVTGPDGAVSTQSIDYRVNTSQTGIRNQRYSVFALNGAGAGVVDSPSNVNPGAEARLVDASGNDVSPGTAGYLQIRGASGSYRIAIDGLDSEDGGDPSDPANTQTLRGFSHFFGLNDFFVPYASTANSAVNFRVRDDILANPSKIVTAGLTLSLQPNDGSALYTYELGAGGNQAIIQMAGFSDTLLDFSAAGTLAAISATSSEYAAQLTSFSALQVKESEDALAREQNLQSVYEARSSAISGVNVDEELANTVLYQTAYTASARVLNTLRELFDLLFDIL